MINLLYPKMKSKFTTILLIATSLAYGAEPLPKEAVDLLMKRQEAISRIDETLVAELEKVKLASMKKGDLAAANAVDLLIKEQAGDSRLIGGNTPASKGGSTLPIRFRAGMKLLWSPQCPQICLLHIGETRQDSQPRRQSMAGFHRGLEVGEQGSR